MTARLASITTIAIALVLGATSVATATTGPVASGNAAGVQYQPEETGIVPLLPPEQPPPAQPPAEPVTAASSEPTPPAPEPEPIPAAEPSSEKPEQPEQPAAKAETTTKPVAETSPVAQAAAVPQEGHLPLTGYNALPVAIGGLALLGLGLALRLQTRRQNG